MRKHGVHFGQFKDLAEVVGRLTYVFQGQCSNGKLSSTKIILNSTKISVGYAQYTFQSLCQLIFQLIFQLQQILFVISTFSGYTCV